MNETVVATRPALAADQMGVPDRNPGVQLDPALYEGVSVNRSAAERRSATMATRRTVKKQWQAAWLVRAIECIDLTTLSGDDTPDRVRRLCAKARNPLRDDLVASLGLSDAPPRVGAVCVYPTMVPHAVAALSNSGIPVASVATGFPSGLTPMEQRLAEIAYAVDHGASEIDIVITRAHVLCGNWTALYDEVARMREACGEAHLKAILGTGDLKTLTNVYRASMVSMMAGADVVKTSTGKEVVNATLPVSLTMVRAVRDYAESTGYRVGFKPAGGLKAAKEAIAWLILMKEELGTDWTKPDLFRIGASSLLTDIERQIEHFATGRYSADFRHPDELTIQRRDRHMNEIRDILRTMDYGPAPEDDSHVRGWLKKNAKRFGHFIDGEFVWPRGTQSFPVFNPATGKQIAKVANGSSKDVDAANRAARKALVSWSSTSGAERARHLYAVARQVQKHSRFLAVLETIDNGKPIRETRDIDIPLVARHFYHHAGWAALAEGEFAGYEAAGVCGQVIPWNFPLLMLAWKVAPALAAGCTVVLKPAEFTPLTALAFAEICREAGLPAGVFNVVNGDGETGAAIVNHDGFDKVAFTGSTEVGRIIRKATAGTGKKLSLELGGKSPFIVFEDADLDGAVEGVVDAIWFNQGQVCCAGSRLLVQEGIAARFYEKLRARMEKLRVGDPLDKAVDMGTLVAPVQRERVDSLVRKGIEDGAERWCPSWTVSEKGSFYPPTLFTGVDPASTLAQEEIFGPVLVATTFRTPDEAVTIANNTRYGLAASIWSQTIDVAFDAARSVKAGVVWINSTNLFDAVAGFGGYRESGFGREGGKEGMYEYLKLSQWVGAKDAGTAAPLADPLPGGTGIGSGLDRTAKLYIGGKQVRPDSGYSDPVYSKKGELISEAGRGNRKDIRNAVEAAHAGAGWSAMTGHQRAQVLYFLAENLQIRADEFTARLAAMTGTGSKAAAREVSASVARIVEFAAWADKYDGAVRAPQTRMLSLALNEPFGVMGISCPDEAPLLAFVSLIMPAIAMGNRVVVTPSPSQPLAATDFYQVLETSDVPAGVVNIVTGDRDELAAVMARHDDIACCWYFGSPDGSRMVELESAGNLKSTWVNRGKQREWANPTPAEQREYLRHACQIKTIWTPFGA